MEPAIRPVPTPCTGVCTIGGDGMCHGCYRTRAEIAAWSQMRDAERLHLMASVLPGRAPGRT